MELLHTLARAAVHGVRRMRRQPAQAAALVMTLAIGVGATTFIFSVAYGVLLRPLPYGSPEQLVRLTTTTAADGAGGVSLADFDDWQRRSSSFASMAAYVTNDASLSTVDRTDAVRIAIVSDDFFTVLDTPPAAGRLLAPADARTPVAVLSWSAWQQRFSGAPAVLGSTVRINGEATTIVGVASQRFAFPAADIDLFIPLTHARGAAPPQWNMRGFRAFDAVARLRDGMSAQAAGADLQRVARDLAAEYPRFNRETSASVVSLRDSVTASVREPLAMLSAAVALLLLVACANAASLALVGAAAQRSEGALRTALGASRRRLVVERLLESAVVAGLAAATGVALASVLHTTLLAFPPTGLPRLEDVRLDAPVLAFAVITTMFSTLGVTLIPAMSATRVNPAGALDSTRLVSGRTRRRTERALTVVQIALGLLLLAGSGALVQRLSSMLAAASGTAEDIVTARLSLAPAAYAAPDAQQRFMTRVLADLQRQPGVRAAMISSLPPATAQMRTTIAAPAGGSAEEVPIDVIAITPEALDVLAVPILSGRTIADSDTTDSARVAVLSASAARRLFGDVSPLGRTIPFGMSPGSQPTVIGVAGDVRYHGLDAAAAPAMYLPATQRPFRTQYVLLRAAAPDAAPRFLMNAVRSVDPAVAVSQIRTFAALRADATAGPRFRSLVLGAITLASLLLAAIGLYGVVAQGALGRVREFAVRVAVGATPARVARLVLTEAMALTGAGVAIGLAATLAANRFASTRLAGIPRPGVSIVLAAMGLLAAVSLISGGIPAWRAARRAPADTLRG